MKVSPGTCHNLDILSFNDAFDVLPGCVMVYHVIEKLLREKGSNTCGN